MNTQKGVSGPADTASVKSMVSARQTIRRVAVLGAGTMGSQIAAHIANQGIPCDLLDLPSEGTRNRLVEEAKKRLLVLKPSPLYSPDSLNLIHPGNFSDDLPRLRDVDWVIEAVVEKLDIKRKLWSQVAPHLPPDAIVSTNTSGIPIASIAEALPKDIRQRFLGTHFFNPPRYLRLLEVITTSETDEAVVAAIRRFAERILGKGVVMAHDVPGFISNRIGCYGFVVSLRAMEEFGLGPDEVDSITGPAMGRPNSATFRTLDLVGMDIFIDVCDNLRASIKDPREQSAFELPGYIREMMRRGWLGEKVGQGFYKRVDSQGESQIVALHPETLEYRPRRGVQAASLAAVRDIEDAGERLRKLIAANDAASRFAWRVLSQTLVYSAQKVGDVADDVASIDRAMRLGFGWDLGPFGVWDALGVAETVRRMQSDGISVPQWVTKLAEQGKGFYSHEGERSIQATPSSAYVPISESERVIPLERLRAVERRVAQRPGATLYDLGDDVAFLDFHSPKQAIGPDMLDMQEEAARRVQQEFRGLVISSHVLSNFCVGANLALILMAAQEGEWEEIDTFVKRFQYGLLCLKRLPVPVVVAPYGMTLGGGVEIAFAGARVVAAAETYMGLVETGVGVIPAGGGCKEMLLRSLETLPGGLEAFAARGKGGPPSITPDIDPNPLIAKAFETIGLAKVSGNAAEARALGFLRDADMIVPNMDHLFYTAKEAVLALDAKGYVPTASVRLPVLGEGTRALLGLAAQHIVWGGYGTEHDLKIARKLAYVLTGGDRPPGSLAEEEYFLDLEREAFLSLCGEPKTQARMQYMLQRGRPLRN